MKRTASLLIAGALACSSPAREEREANPIEQPAVALRIATVNYPLAWMASRLLPSAEVLFPAPTGIDPAYWQPDSQTISGVYQAADIIALNGAGYARWVALATLPEEALVDTAGAIQDRLLARTGAPTHSHGPEGEHTHVETAFTLWLDPTLAFAQAEALAAAMKAKAPQSAAEIDSNLISIESDLTELDLRFERSFARIADAPLLMSHPVYAYLDGKFVGCCEPFFKWTIRNTGSGDLQLLGRFRCDTWGPVSIHLEAGESATYTFTESARKSRGGAPRPARSR